MDAIILRIAGNNRHISPSVFLTHVARALANTSLPAGEHTIEIHRDGSVSVNGMVAYVAPRPLIAKKGA